MVNSAEIKVLTPMTNGFPCLRGKLLEGAFLLSSNLRDKPENWDKSAES